MSDDLARGDVWPLQHHDPAFTPSTRRRLRAMRVHPQEGNNYAPTHRTAGDIQGGLLWVEQAGKREFLNSWFMTGAGAVVAAGGGGSGDTEGTRTRPNALALFATGPTVGDGGSSGGAQLLPIRKSGGLPDDRYAVKGASVGGLAPMSWPKGWTGTVTAGTEEQSQQETFHPDALGLVAVNFAGDPKAGTPVYDLKEDGSLDRYARLQSLVSVVKFGDDTTALAWQLGKGGRLDGGSGSGMVCDHTSGEVGYATSRKGGPWLVGGARGCSLHVIGRDADNKPIRPVHNDVGALYIMDGTRDGPLAFEAQFYDKEALELPVSTQCHLRFDPGNPALGSAGAWRWQASCAFYIPLEPFVDPEPDPKKPPPPHGDPPPPGGNPPPFLPDGSGVGTTGGGFLPGGSLSGPGFGTGFPTGLPGDEFGTIPGTTPAGSGEPPDTGVDVLGGKDTSFLPPGPTATPSTTTGQSLAGQIYDALKNPLRPFGFPSPAGSGGAAEGGDEIGTVGGAQTPVIGDQTKPTYPTSPNCLQVPNIIFKGVATAPGELNVTGARTQTAETIKAFDGAPQIAHFAGMAAGDGTWAGFTKSAEASATEHAKATGMVMLLPPDVTVAQVAAGTATTATPAQVSVPTGLSEISFGTPNPTTGRTGSGVTCKGYAGGLLISMTDGNGVGVVGGPAIQVGEGGTDITGNASVSGKLTVGGRLDPTTLEFTDTAVDNIPNGEAGLRFDSTFDTSNHRPLWKRPDDNSTEQIAYLSDLGGGGGSPTTTRGDLIRRGAVADERLGIGAAARILASDGTDPVWQTITTWLDAAIGSTTGIMLYRSALTWTSVSAPTIGQLLTTATASAVPEWKDPEDVTGVVIPGFAEVGTSTANTQSHVIPSRSTGAALRVRLAWDTNADLALTLGAVDLIPSVSNPLTKGTGDATIVVTGSTTATVIWEVAAAGGGGGAGEIEFITGLDWSGDQTLTASVDTGDLAVLCVEDAFGGQIGGAVVGSVSTDLMQRVGLPSPAAHWDASDSDSLTLTGSLVDQADDRSGNGLHLTGTTTARPTLASGAINGLDAFDFDGGDLLERTGASGSFSGSSGEVWAVVRLDVDTFGYAWRGSNTGDATRYVGGYREETATPPAGPRFALTQRNADTADILASTTTALAINTTYIVRWTSDGSTNSLWVNGVAQTLAVSAGANTGDWFADTTRDQFSLGFLLEGKIGEVAVFESLNLTVAQAQSMLEMWAEKWGVTL